MKNYPACKESNSLFRSTLLTQTTRNSTVFSDFELKCQVLKYKGQKILMSDKQDSLP